MKLPKRITTGLQFVASVGFKYLYGLSLRTTTWFSEKTRFGWGAERLYCLKRLIQKVEGRLKCRETNQNCTVIGRDFECRQKAANTKGTNFSRALRVGRNFAVRTSSVSNGERVLSKLKNVKYQSLQLLDSKLQSRKKNKLKKPESFHNNS